jgi:uncharacterized protein YbcI
VSPGESAVSGEQLAAISREMMRLKARHYGKGPVEAKSYSNDDFIFSVLKGGLTPVERTLSNSGRQDLVREVRLAFQAEMGHSFKEAVETIVGRRVKGYESQIIFDPDYVVEIFLLGERFDDPAAKNVGGADFPEHIGEE